MAQLTHIALHVADVDAVSTFYQDWAALQVVHERASAYMKVVWLVAEGDSDFVLVLLSGGVKANQCRTDFSHLGFALPDREAVDQLADRAAREGCLVWPVIDEPWPTGYYCGVRDPDGNIVEFSFGQPDGRGILSSRNS